VKAYLLSWALFSVVAVPAFAQSGSWTITDKTSALDGSQSYMAILESDDAVAGLLGQQKKAGLAFVCERRGFVANITWPDFVEYEADDPSVAVSWKLDDGKPQQTNWLGTTTAVGQVGPRGLATLKDWSAGHKLIVRVPDHHGGQEVTFTLDGILGVYSTLSSRSCG
jgi:hypothetical protein